MTYSTNTLLLLLEEADFPCFTIYIHYIFSEHFQVKFLRDKQLRKATVLVFKSPTPGAFSPMFSLLPKHWWTFRGDEKCSSLLRGAVKAEVGFFFFFFSGEVSLVESNGLVGTRVSVESHNSGPRSLHWPECLSGLPQTACDAGGTSNRDRDSSCFAFSSFCGGWDPLPLGVSGIAAGSERGTHLTGGQRESTGVTHHPHILRWISCVLPLIARPTCSPCGGRVVIVVGSHSLGFSNTVV